MKRTIVILILVAALCLGAGCGIDFTDAGADHHCVLTGQLSFVKGHPGADLGADLRHVFLES